MNPFEQIVEATVAGDQERCVALARQALEQGVDPLQAIEQGYSKGMTIVGEKFARMEYYLPELMRCADAMKAAMDVLRPHLVNKADGDTGAARGTVVLGTIQGDLHDLGKNIVRTMLQAGGFTVHDLGCDVPVRSFIDKAEETGADLIAASAILTTTMAYMPDLVAILSEMGLRDRFRVMLGGAPVTPEYAKEAGADGYGENAAQAVDVARQLVHAQRASGRQGR
jgi:corrinoid protein of di/trimethylamine methyltransferase